jgi:hypothetical protein
MQRIRPIRFSELLPEVAGTVGQSVIITDAVFRLYWREVRGALSGLAHPRVQVANLGSFNIKPVAMGKRLVRRQRMLERIGLEKNEISETRQSISLRKKNIRLETELEIRQLLQAGNILTQEKNRKMNMKKSRMLAEESEVR